MASTRMDTTNKAMLTPSRCVYASSSRFSKGEQCKSTAECCAERRLLNIWIEKAKKKGVPSHRTVHWIRRKIGPDISTWRITSDGQHGCSIPCIYCRDEIIKFDLRVTCCIGKDQWFCGFLNDVDAPQSKLTSGQVAALRHKVL